MHVDLVHTLRRSVLMALLVTCLAAPVVQATPDHLSALTPSSNFVPNLGGTVKASQSATTYMQDEPLYEKRRLTILSSLCPPGYVGGGDYYSDCRSGHGIGLEFRMGLPNSDGFTEFVPTDEYGVVSFEIWAVGINDSIRIIEALPTGIVHTFPDCYSGSGEQLLVTMPDYSENPTIAVADVVIGQTGDVVCNWFNAPQNAH
ncbi:MAG: hypothetical protein K1X67_20590 [Fimbriimonadaceae bacterium]|nr:hypothetical protein [Fimbriimonadaceae bacterium]